MKNQLQKFSRKEKDRPTAEVPRFIKALGGVAIIVFMYINNGFDMSGTAEAAGYNIFAIVIMLIGLGLIISSIKQRK